MQQTVYFRKTKKMKDLEKCNCSNELDHKDKINCSSSLTSSFGSDMDSEGDSVPKSGVSKKALKMQKTSAAAKLFVSGFSKNKEEQGKSSLVDALKNQAKKKLEMHMVTQFEVQLKDQMIRNVEKQLDKIKHL